jgi:hypothetical protein
MVPVSSYPEVLTTTTVKITKTKIITVEESSSTVYPDTTITKCMEGAYCPSGPSTPPAATPYTTSCAPRKTVTSTSTSWVSTESKSTPEAVYSPPPASTFYTMPAKNETVPYYTPPSPPTYEAPTSKKLDADSHYSPSPAPVPSASASMPYDVTNSTKPTTPVYNIPPVESYTGGAMRQGMSVGVLTVAVAGVVGLIAFM